MINDVLKMKLKVNLGIENYDFDNGVVAVIILIRFFRQKNKFKKIFLFNRPKLSYFFEKNFYFAKFDTN